jgi:outer membrane protein assembly factor BamA
MSGISFVLLILFVEPVSRDNAMVLRPPSGSSRGVIRQQRQPAYYRVSKVTIEGATAFSADQITNLAELKVGRLVGEQAFAQAREAIGRAYANRGRIKAKVRIQPDFKPVLLGAKQGVVDVIIEIEEGAVFRLRRLEFIGNKTTRDRIVRRRVLQQEGEPYSQELMEKSVNRLNGLRRFEKLTMADVESRIDEKEFFVDLLVRLKEIKVRRTRR